MLKHLSVMGHALVVAGFRRLPVEPGDFRIVDSSGLACGHHVAQADLAGRIAGLGGTAKQPQGFGFVDFRAPTVA